MPLTTRAAAFITRQLQFAGNRLQSPEKDDVAFYLFIAFFLFCIIVYRALYIHRTDFTGI